MQKAVKVISKAANTLLQSPNLSSFNQFLQESRNMPDNQRAQICDLFFYNLILPNLQDIGYKQMLKIYSKSNVEKAIQVWNQNLKSLEQKKLNSVQISQEELNVSDQVCSTFFSSVLQSNQNDFELRNLVKFSQQYHIILDVSENAVISCLQRGLENLNPYQLEAALYFAKQKRDVARKIVDVLLQKPPQGSLTNKIKIMQVCANALSFIQLREARQAENFVNYLNFVSVQGYVSGILIPLALFDSQCFSQRFYNMINISDVFFQRVTLSDFETLQKFMMQDSQPKLVIFNIQSRNFIFKIAEVSLKLKQYDYFQYLYMNQERFMQKKQTQMYGYIFQYISQQPNLESYIDPIKQLIEKETIDVPLLINMNSQAVTSIIQCYINQKQYLNAVNFYFDAVHLQAKEPAFQVLLDLAYHLYTEGNLQGLYLLQNCSKHRIDDNHHLQSQLDSFIDLTKESLTQKKQEFLNSFNFVKHYPGVAELLKPKEESSNQEAVEGDQSQKQAQKEGDKTQEDLEAKNEQKQETKKEESKEVKKASKKDDKKGSKKKGK